jgi:hypothetical protein
LTNTFHGRLISPSQTPEVYTDSIDFLKNWILALTLPNTPTPFTSLFWARAIQKSKRP